MKKSSYSRVTKTLTSIIAATTIFSLGYISHELQDRFSIPVENIIEEEFDGQYMGEYRSLFENVDGIVLTQILGDDFDNNFLSEYLTFLENVDMDKFRLLKNVVNFDNNKLSDYTEFLNEVGVDELYDLNLARITDGSLENISIYVQLSKREVIPRENATYPEGIDQIFEITNSTIIDQVQQYINFFDNEDNKTQISNLLLDDIYNMPFSEAGGIIIDNSIYGFQFVQINSTLEEIPQNNDYYKPPEWVKYVSKIGLCHFHATSEDDTRFSGPSEPGREGNANDLGFIQSREENNPYEMDCVITKLSDERYNVDIYFRDVIEMDHEITNVEQFTVIDLGTYPIKEWE